MKIPSDQDASGRSLGVEELTFLEEVIRSGCLTVTKGRFATEFERRFAGLYDVPHVVMCSSGSAAMHAALAALDLEPGSEVIVTPLTDFGGVAPILWQGCIPVFADVDPHSLQPTPASIGNRITERTRAIVVTHLFGNPSDIVEICRMARSLGIWIIEDCAQAFLSKVGGQNVGVFGDIACFSLQQTKHISTGEGGVVITQSSALFSRAHQFINKGRIYSDEWPDHHFLGMNYRATELQAAVALAQLQKLEECVLARRATGSALVERLTNSKLLAPLKVLPFSESSFWRIGFVVNGELPLEELRGMRDRLDINLRTKGVVAAPHYLKPAFEWSLFRDRKTFGTGSYPFTLAHPNALDFSEAKFTGVLRALSSLLTLPWTEAHTPAHVDYICDAFQWAMDSV